MTVIRFATGLAIGYVLGSRAGREKYDQIVATARRTQAHPAVTQVQQKAKALLATDTTEAAIDPAPSTVDVSVPSSTPAPRPPRRRPRSTQTTTMDPLA